MENFWQNLARPFVGLSPMDGVTDQAYRHIICKHSSPDVVFTEFVNVEGLCHNASRLLRPLLYDNSQRPIVAQLYGKTPQSFRQAALLVAQLGFDGVDINMGCPSKCVAGGGSGAGLIKTPQLALEIIQAVKNGVNDWHNGASVSDVADFTAEFAGQVERQRLAVGLEPTAQLDQRQLLPVSVKTRIGYEEPEVNGWLKLILETEPSAFTIHGRTLKQAYKGKADWSVIEETADIARRVGSSAVIIGNGDVQSRSHGEKLAKQHRVGGVLIGRATQGNPFVFDQEETPPSPKKLAAVALDHARVYEDTYSSHDKYAFLPMRKHLAWYIKGVDQAKQIRQQLVLASSSQDVEKILTAYQLLS
jgi:tRNA-dihydrouridine synthase B